MATERHGPTQNGLREDVTGGGGGEGVVHQSYVGIAHRDVWHLHGRREGGMVSRREVHGEQIAARKQALPLAFGLHRGF